MDRAFTAWGANNRNIKFIDVTAECELLKENFYDETHTGPPGLNYAVGNDGDSGFHGGCPLAEIWVTKLDHDPTANPGEIAVAEALSFLQLDDSGKFHFTNGVAPTRPSVYGEPPPPRRVLESYAGKLSIRTEGKIGDNDLCWYLDSGFCSAFHELKRDMKSSGGSKALISAICWLITLGAGLFAVYTKLSALMACFGYSSAGKRNIDRDGDGNLSCAERFYGFVEEAADWNPLAFAIVICLFMAPLLLLYSIFLPCWDCADFEAAMLHEIGHFLGLGHPDNVPSEVLENANLYNPSVNDTAATLLSYHTIVAAGGALTSANCGNVWRSVVGGVPEDSDELEHSETYGYNFRGSVMEAFTQHNPRPCLTKDDVEAISVLYPDCLNATSRQGGVVTCHIMNHNIGLVRVTVYVVFPLLFAFIFIVLFSSFIHCYKTDELEEARLQQLQAEEKLERLKELYKNGPPPKSAKKSRFHLPQFPKNRNTDRNTDTAEASVQNVSAEVPYGDNA